MTIKDVLYDNRGEYSSVLIFHPIKQLTQTEIESIKNMIYYKKSLNTIDKLICTNNVRLEYIQNDLNADVIAYKILNYENTCKMFNLDISIDEFDAAFSNDFFDNSKNARVLVIFIKDIIEEGSRSEKYPDVTNPWADTDKSYLYNQWILCISNNGKTPEISRLSGSFQDILTYISDIIHEFSDSPYTSIGIDTEKIEIKATVDDYDYNTILSIVARQEDSLEIRRVDV